MKVPDPIAAAAQYVRHLFATHPDPRLLYHDLGHTERVVAQAERLGRQYGLGSYECGILLTAAWFHDVGHLFGQPRGHEEGSVAQFLHWAVPQRFEPHFTEAVAGCIYATRLPHKPRSFLEEIICDADTYNLGTDEFLQTDPRLKEELRLRMGEEPLDWDAGTLLLLQTHRFFTPYCRERLAEGLRENIRIVEERIAGKPATPIGCRR